MDETTAGQALEQPKRSDNLRPNFTSSNAREMALKSAEVRRAARDARIARKLQREAEQDNPAVSSDDTRRVRCARQVDVLLGSLEKAKSDEARFAIIAALEKLWKLVQPTAGVAKPKRGRIEAPTVS